MENMHTDVRVKRVQDFKGYNKTIKYLAITGSKSGNDGSSGLRARCWMHWNVWFEHKKLGYYFITRKRKRMVTSLDGIKVALKKKNMWIKLYMYPTWLPGKLFVEQGWKFCYIWVPLWPAHPHHLSKGKRDYLLIKIRSPRNYWYISIEQLIVQSV